MDRLTLRERDVLICRCREGLTEAETAKRLGITHHTVKNHATAILKKTRFSAIQQACFAFSPAMRPVELAEWPFGRVKTLATRTGTAKLLMQHPEPTGATRPGEG